MEIAFATTIHFLRKERNEGRVTGRSTKQSCLARRIIFLLLAVKLSYVESFGVPLFVRVCHMQSIVSIACINFDCTFFVFSSVHISYQYIAYLLKKMICIDKIFIVTCKEEHETHSLQVEIIYLTYKKDFIER